MISVRARLGGAAPDPTELLSIGERARYLLALRVALGIGGVGIAFGDPDLAPHASTIASGTILYLAITAAASLLEHRSEALVLPILRATLLLDGLALAAAVAATGAATSPVRFLAFGHVVVVTLLFSYRSGLKIAMWHSLLYLLVAFSEPAQIIGGDRSYATIETTTIWTIVWLWLATLVTATFAALSERELRRQKVDLERLSAMLRRIQSAESAPEIADILVVELTDTFAFRAGAVLASPEGELSPIATVGDVVSSRQSLPEDPVVRRALSERSVVALQRFDEETDPGLAATFPRSRNVLVVPLLADRGRALGVVVLERGGHQRGIRRWLVAMVEQFVSHGALALSAAWLSEERQARIREIQELQRQLEVHNAHLETKVAERTAELRTAVEHLEEVDAQRRRLLDHVVRVGEEERQRIAGDIHDDPVQKLVALKMRLELLGKAHPNLEGIPEARDSVLVAIRGLRHLLFDLRPPVLDEQGLGPALRSFFENAEVTFRWAVEDDLVEQPSPQTRLILYRIAQEALTNVRKHASADHVRVRLSESDGGVAMEIVDDGVGFQPQDAVVAAPGHMGLAAMRERAEMAGGRCELHSLPGQGTTLDVWMPASLDRMEPSVANGRELASFASLDPGIDREASEWVAPPAVEASSGNGARSQSVA
jgi:signal transduction histidine kinase